MTVFAWARARLFPELPEPEARLIRVSPDTQVLARCFWQPDRASVPTLLALHGLEGSSEAHYMRGLAAKAWQRGWNAVLLNQRNCGGTEHLTPGLYHSGLTEDPKAVIRALVQEDRLPCFGVVGYSLGGNLAVKLAGELDAVARPARGRRGRHQPDDRPRPLRPRDRAPGQRHLPVQFRAESESPDAEESRGLAGEVRPRGRFDRSGRSASSTKFTRRPITASRAPADYYHRASAVRVVDRIRVPTLILSAEDDPFVPASQFQEPALRENRHIALCIERNGGHCGFAGQRDGRRRLLGGDDGGELSGRGHATLTPRRFSTSTNAWANSGPFPSSSCLK